MTVLIITWYTHPLDVVTRKEDRLTAELNIELKPSYNTKKFIKLLMPAKYVENESVHTEAIIPVVLHVVYV